jgi:hypothetical protein
MPRPPHPSTPINQSGPTDPAAVTGESSGLAVRFLAVLTITVINEWNGLRSSIGRELASSISGEVVS